MNLWAMVFADTLIVPYALSGRLTEYVYLHFRTTVTWGRSTRCTINVGHAYCSLSVRHTSVQYSGSCLVQSGSTHWPIDHWNWTIQFHVLRRHVNILFMQGKWVWAAEGQRNWFLGFPKQCRYIEHVRQQCVCVRVRACVRTHVGKRFNPNSVPLYYKRFHWCCAHCQEFGTRR
jgi:hypothetical protein